MDLLVKVENHQIRTLDTGQTSILEVGFCCLFSVKKGREGDYKIVFISKPSLLFCVSSSLHK